MNKTTTKTAMTLSLILACTGAMAQSALSELKVQAGDDAVAAAAKSVPAAQARPVVTPETSARLQNTFRPLRDAGFPGVEWGRLPLGVRYVRVPLQLVTCPGCVSYTALLPAGALTPTAPIGDPNKAPYFILERSGEWIRPDASYSKPIALPRDVFAACADIDAMTLRAWTLPEAVQHVQSCLDKSYFQSPLARRAYFVSAKAGRFGVRACPDNAPRTCQAIIEVEGVVIAVSGRVPAGDSVLSDIAYSLQKRGGKLMGFHAIAQDKTVR